MNLVTPESRRCAADSSSVEPGEPRPRRCLLAIVVIGAAALSCGAPRLADLPSGGGAPFAEFAGAYAQATERCRDIRALTAELRLSGRAGGRKIPRARLLSGFASPGQIRLEALAPFGRPVFVLVAQGDSATLVLSRERRVLRGAPPDQIVEALTGVALGPDELRAVVSGCGLGATTPSGGQMFGAEWATVNGGGTTHWLRRVGGTWQVAAAVRDAIEIRYDAIANGWPTGVRVRTSTPSRGLLTDLWIFPSQIELPDALGPEAFEVDVPADAVPLTLEELRRAGPLGDTSSEARPPTLLCHLGANSNDFC